MSLNATDFETPTGRLIFQLTRISTQIPIENATITITSSDRPGDEPYILTTDSSGRSEEFALPAPPLANSLEPDQNRPYSLYRFRIYAEGYEPVTIEDAEIFPEVLSIQPVQMVPLRYGTGNETIIIAPHTLYGDYPAKIPESEIKPVEEDGSIVLSRVVIPEYIIVHDGVPNDKNAPDYYIPYKDYIKNVVSSEIYSTWPESAIYANTFAIMSFTLNRVYTEWYRNRGYSFTITSSTAYDQKFIYGRTIYENISRIVDSVFVNYISRPGILQPLFTSYCNGTTATCNGLSQWGSKYLADEGYSPIEILRYYYGNDIFINTATSVSGVPASWPGAALSTGSRGNNVLTLQRQLARISRSYPAIPAVSVDGIYGEKTAEAVKTFQRIFNLSPTGVVDFATWYEISNIFVGVTKIAEP